MKLMFLCKSKESLKGYFRVSISSKLWNRVSIMKKPLWLSLYEKQDLRGLANVDLNELYQGNTALGYFILENDLEIVKYLCETLKVDPNEHCHFTVADIGLPALLWSRFWMSEGMIQVLLDNGADVSAMKNIVEEEGISNLLHPHYKIFEEYEISRKRRIEEATATMWVGKNILGSIHDDLFLRDVCVEVVSKRLADMEWTLKRY